MCDLSTDAAGNFFAGCLKQSIRDTVLDANNSGKHAATATLSYKINGTEVNGSVDNADNRRAGYNESSCNKYPGYFGLGAVTGSGEFTFLFFTDRNEIIFYFCRCLIRRSNDPMLT